VTTQDRDEQRESEGQDVGGVVRDAVDNDRGHDHGARNAALLERPGDDHRSADSGRRQSLVDEELGETELERCGERHRELPSTRDDPPGFPLREISAHLKKDGNGKPPRLCVLRDAHELSLLREVEHGDDDRGEHREAEDPGDPLERTTCGAGLSRPRTGAGTVQHHLVVAAAIHARGHDGISFPVALARFVPKAATSLREPPADR